MEIIEEGIAMADAEAVTATAGMDLIGIMFSLLPLFILLCVVITLAIVLPITLSSKRRKAEATAQQAQPEARREIQALQAEGRVITKRVHAGTEYFIGFEFADGNRVELQVDGSLYGVLLEGDEGLVTWHERRLLEFSRRTDH